MWFTAFLLAVNHQKQVFSSRADVEIPQYICSINLKIMEKNTSINEIEQHIIDVAISLRHKHNLRQSDLGKILNTSPSFIGNVENYNNPAKYNLKHINAMAHYFNIAPRYFMPEKPFPNNPKQ